MIPQTGTVELQAKVEELQRKVSEYEEAAKQAPVAWIEKDELELELLGHKGELYGSMVYKKPLLPEYQEAMENPVPLYCHPPNLPAMIEQAIKEEYNKLSPIAWTRAMSDAWHRAIPDLQAAFDALISEAIRARRGE